MPPLDPSPLALPTGHELERVLSERPDERVVLARNVSGRVVLRLVRQARDLGGELDVLARLRSPRLAALVDAGTLPGGGAYVSREWIEGDDLGRLGPFDARPAAELVVEIARALEVLHRAGFAHGDVKPANLVRRPDGSVVLTDFGLASRRASGGRGVPRPAPGGVGGGSFGYAAPEVLVGAPVDAGADLFSLGVTWLVLRGCVLPAPPELYGRFPSEPFRAASGIDFDSLDEDTRDLALELLHRDPAERPSSAAAVARRIAVRFGLLDAAAPTRLVAPYWSHLAGRSGFVEARLAALEAAGGAEFWSAASDDEGGAFAREVALALAVRGRAVTLVDLGLELASLTDTVAVDRWLARLEGLARDVTVLLSGDPGPWAGQLRLGLPHLELKRGAAWCARHPGAGSARRFDVPAQGRTALAALVGRVLPASESEQLEQLVDALEVEGRGSSSAAGALVADLFARKLVIDEGDGPRLARDIDLREALRGRQGLGARELRSLPEPERLLLVAAVALGPSPLTRLVRTAGVDVGVDVEARIDELVQRGLLRVLGAGNERRIAAIERVGALELGFGRKARAALFGRVAHELESSGAPTETSWAARFLEGLPNAVTGIADEARRLRWQGVDVRVRTGLKRLREAAVREGEPVSHDLVRELALACVALGEFKEALTELDSLPRSNDARRVAEEVRGRIASLAGHFDEAIQAFERAGSHAEVAAERVRKAFYAGDHALAQRLATSAMDALGAESEGAERAWTLPVLIDVHSIAAMAAQRSGDVAAARVWLERAEVAAKRAGSATYSGAHALNVGTALRRVGDLAGARVQHERAVRAYRELGLASGLAQARLALSGVLRELGRMAEAEPLVHEALGSRRRLGDVAGAATAQGMLGLLLADRGHLHTAAIELARAGAALARHARTDQSHLVRARELELRARLGQLSPADLDGDAAGQPELASDPRVPLALGRAAWCVGLTGRAEQLLERAMTDARATHRETVAHEAAWLLAELRGAASETGVRAVAISAESTVASSVEIEHSLGHEDARLAALLGAEPLDGRALLDLAQGLVQRGRDDRGARAAIGVAARDVDPARRERAAALARSALERVALGAAPEHAAHATRTLLGRPDPRPEDLERWRTEPEDEMDVLTVLGINERLVEQQDLDTLLGAIVDAAVEVTGSERGFLVLEEHGELSLDRALDSSRGDLDSDEVEYSQSIVRAALERGGPLRIADAGEDVRYGDARSVTSFELRSVLCQPFDVEEGLRGVIVVDDRRRPGVFGPREERLLGLLAGQAALAVRQVRRLESITRLRDELAARVVERESRLEVVERRLEARGQVPPVEGLIGESTVMQAVHRLLRKVAPSDLAVLVSGESGTGKEVAARALHALSPRAKGPFVAENCAALPATLLESELFGSRKGSFTGAERDREGLFERAHGGTLFLDEIGELPLDQQAKLLRVLETREVRRIGDSETRSVDFRLVAATNRDLAAEVRDGRFREDLMYRLDTVRIVMPPLRERLEDLPALVAHFLRLAAAKDGRLRKVSPEVLKTLAARPWPGNVRELANEIARLLVLSDGDLVDPALVRSAATPSGGAARVDLVRPLEELEREAILAALARTGGDKRRAAELLGISRAKVYQRLKEWRLE